MNIVMGYHVLLHNRDYWSTEPDLAVSVPYLSRIMILKRFEEIRAYLPFKSIENLKPTSESEHDRAFKFV